MRTTLALRLIVVLLLALLTVTPAHADNVTLSYDPVGNIATRSTSFGTTTYTYDALSRLTAETGPTGNFSYSYDANGNRLSDARGNYTYAPGSNRIATRYGLAITTDAAGNITADGQGHSYTFNEEGYLSEARLNGVLLASYDYDFQGRRARKVTTAAAPQGAQTVLYHYDEAGHLIAETTGTGAALRTYVWRDDTPIAQIDHVPTRHIRYFETDHLNTPRAAMDEVGRVIWRWESDAFGNTLPNENPSGLGNVTINLRFPGQYYDQETGLHYNGFRYYHPGMGQYIQPDPIGLKGGTFSTYAYVKGNPLRYVDPRGLDATVVVNGNNVTITIPITYSGSGATPQVIQTWNSAIQNSWSGQFGQYTVITTVTNGSDNQIAVPLGDGRAYVNGVGGNSGVWSSERPGWTAAHEAGHLMGLDDQYDYGTGLPKPGWGNDIMGARDKPPSAQDIADIVRANANASGSRRHAREPNKKCK